MYYFFGIITISDAGMILFSPFEDEKIPEFVANHPFIYFIWDKRTRVPIFSGRIVKLQPKLDPPRQLYIEEEYEDYEDEDFM